MRLFQPALELTAPTFAADVEMLNTVARHVDRQAFARPVEHSARQRAPRADWIRSRSSTPISKRSPMNRSSPSARTSARASQRFAVSILARLSRIQSAMSRPGSATVLSGAMPSSKRSRLTSS